MDFELSEEQKQIKTMVRDFCKKEIDPKRIRDIEQKVYEARTCAEVKAVFPRDLLVKLNDAGLRQLCIPAKYGGTEPESGGNITRAIVVEEMAYLTGGAAVLLATPFMICGATLSSKYVTQEQKERFYKEFMDNPQMWLAGSVTSPSGGVDTHLPYDEPGATLQDITAYKDGHEWVINGDKLFCSGGAAADAMAVLVRTDKNGPITESATHFLVSTSTPGISQILNRFSGVEICGNAQTYFDNVRVSEDSIMGQVNKGYYSMSEGGMCYKWMMLLPFLGEIRRVYDDVVAYAKERVQSGKPIIQHSQVTVMLGEAAAQIEALRNFLYRTAWRLTFMKNGEDGPTFSGAWATSTFSKSWVCASVKSPVKSMGASAGQWTSRWSGSTAASGHGRPPDCPPMSTPLNAAGNTTLKTRTTFRTRG
jgi:alkylation response protein AidB-like acyl-CoA dehydrogenase